MTAKAAPPKAEFSIAHSLFSYEMETRVDNERVWIYGMTQIWNITESNILLGNGIVNGTLALNCLAVYNKRSDVARASGVFEIISIDGTALIMGRMLATITDFWTNEPYTQSIFSGHGYVHIRGTVEVVGIQTIGTLEGYCW